MTKPYDANDILRDAGEDALRVCFDTAPRLGANGTGHHSDASSHGTAPSSPPEFAIDPQPFVLRDPRSIPPREWLYGHHYIRGFASSTVAPGGTGKSILLKVEAAAM